MHEIIKSTHCTYTRAHLSGLEDHLTILISLFKLIVSLSTMLSGDSGVEEHWTIPGGFTL